MRDVLVSRRHDAVEEEPDGVVLREVEGDGGRLSRQQPLGALPRDVGRVPPERRRRGVALAVPAGGKQQDLALRPAWVGGGEALGSDRLVRRGIAQVEDAAGADHPVEGRCLDRRRRGDEMRHRIDMGEAVAGGRKPRHPERVAGGDVAFDLHLGTPAEMRPDRHGKIDDAHAGAHSAAWRRSDSCPICALSAAPVSSALAACRSAKTMAAASGLSAISGRTAMIAAKRSRPRSIVSP